MTRKVLLTALLCLTMSMADAAPVQQKAGTTEVSIEFFTPRTVRVVKHPAGYDYEKRSLVVITRPDDVKVTRKGNTVSSDVLTVKMDPRTGA